MSAAALDILENSDFSVSKAIQNAVEAISSRDLGTDILRRALKRADLEEIPEEFAEAAEFILGPLDCTLRRHVGVHIAALLIETLRPILEHGEASMKLKLLEENDEVFARLVHDGETRSGVRIRIPTLRAHALAEQDESPSREAMSAEEEKSCSAAAYAWALGGHPDAPVASAEVVALISEDPMGFDGLSALVTEYAELRGYDSIDELILDLPNLKSCRVVFVFDESTKRVTSALEHFLESALPAKATVVLWGGHAPRRDKLRSKHNASKITWLECPVHATYAEVSAKVKSALRG